MLNLSLNAGGFPADQSLPGVSITKVSTPVSLLSLQPTAECEVVLSGPCRGPGNLFPDPVSRVSALEGAGLRVCRAWGHPARDALKMWPSPSARLETDPHQDFGVRPHGPTRVTSATKTWLRPHCCERVRCLQLLVAV